MEEHQDVCLQIFLQGSNCQHRCSFKAATASTDIPSRQQLPAQMFLQGSNCQHRCSFKAATASTDISSRHQLPAQMFLQGSNCQQCIWNIKGRKFRSTGILVCCLHQLIFWSHLFTLLKSIDVKIMKPAH